MSQNTEELRRKIASSGDLQSVVRTMKALAAANIEQGEQAVRSLANYYRAVELGLGACLRQVGPGSMPVEQPTSAGVIGAVVFGSDQGLVGRFNEVVVEFAVEALSARADQVHLWAVGERAQSRLEDAGLRPQERLAVPNSVEAVAPLAGQILMQAEGLHGREHIDELHVFYNRPVPGSGYAPVEQRLLPLDEQWLLGLIDIPWPTARLAEVLGDSEATLRILTHEFLFISLYRACAESQASENASRLAAMQRADRNIEELLGQLGDALHRQRQSAIDAELFDVISGFEAFRDRSG